MTTLAPTYHHRIYWHLARVRRTTIDDARQRFPTMLSVRKAYGRLLTTMWAGTSTENDQ